MSNILVVSKVRNKILGFQFEENKLSRIYNLENKSLVGNIYVGYVKDIVKNLNAAFVEIDGESKGFLSLKNYPYKIKQGDKILVQVAGDKVKTKDYLLTWKLNISVGSVILTVGNNNFSISKKIDDSLLREQYKNSFSHFCTDEYGFILRTNAQSKDLKNLENNINEAIEIYNQTVNKFNFLKAKTLVYKKDKQLEVLEDFVLKKDGMVITDVEQIYESLKAADICASFNDEKKINLINKYSLEKHLQNSLNRHVWLKSGGYLIIEHTEAMTVIDVNTGKADFKSNRDKTIQKINEEAAKEIARQLQIRNISGTIIVDFIGSDELKNGNLIAVMRQEVKKDYVSCSVVDITKLGLMEITRKKQEQPLYEIFSEAK
ncbi:ribonuclease E/G [uncultured Eubacterium sp.]|uniref:ribonuclease E/G n=1 Tax=uncultured Eubacterium sp. TaxID=165185 RepID=UPI00265CB055|nr:ribonuclease E/G [uncultured Eubacterium sp.]